MNKHSEAFKQAVLNSPASNTTIGDVVAYRRVIGQLSNALLAYLAAGNKEQRRAASKLAKWALASTAELD